MNLPPQDHDAEDYVLGAILLDARAVDETRDLISGHDFSRPSRGKLYALACEMRDNDAHIDIVTVAARLERAGGKDRVSRDELRRLAALVPSWSNAHHYAQIVRHTADARAVLDIAHDLDQAGRNGGLHEHPEVIEKMRQLLDGKTSAREEIELETWRQFEQSGTDHVPCLVDSLWPENAFGFIAAPPKKGKTWVGLSLALAVATGQPFLGHFTVPQPQHVVYLALEGHRAAIRARTGALARGMNVDPDAHDLDRLHIAYKPRGINIADRSWVHSIARTVQEKEARLLIVDVLRAAAQIKENSNEEFSALRNNLQPIIEEGCSIALLHHFGKLTEISRDRDPADRMAGAGAMYGALDVGIFITGYDDEERTFRLAFDCRDLATPHIHGVQLQGEGSGENSGLSYRDAATWTESAAPDEDDVDIPAEELVEWLRDHGQDASKSEIAAACDCSTRTVERREPRMEQLGIEIIRKRGAPNIYRVKPETDEQLAIRNADASDESDLRQGGYDSQPRQQPVSWVNPLEKGVSPATATATTRTPVAPPEIRDLQGLSTHDSHDTLLVSVAAADAAPLTDDPDEIERLEALARTYGIDEDDDQ